MSRVPLRHRLVTRLLATSIVVAVLAVAATAWLATRTVSQAIRQEQGRSLSDEKALYDALIGYAATHRDWSGVGALLTEQSATLSRRVTLTTEDRQVIADSSSTPGPSLATAQPSATVDPLRLDATLTGSTESIDPRAVGPFRITPAQASSLRTYAQDQLACAERSGAQGKITTAPSGRPVVTVNGYESVLTACQQQITSPLVKTERQALGQLTQLAGRCVPDPRKTLASAPADLGSGSLAEQLQTWVGINGDAAALRCLARARRTQLEPYTAPAALLFVTDPDTGLNRPTFTLSRANVIRIATVTGLVLLVTIAVTVLVGRRLVRPLRALTEAAAAQEPVTISTRDEIGYLATALNQATQRRDQAEAQRRAMVGDVAHELRNPLTNIRSWLESAQDGLTSTDRQLVDLLHDETLLLQHIIDDLADLAAADAGTLRLHPEPTDPQDVLDQVLDAHLSAAENAGVVLAVDARTTPPLSADPVRLRQLVGNLVSNAIRHTPAGGSVTLSARAEPGVVILTVRDTGTGIAPEHLPKVFDRFWRADTSRTRATGGSGLGLAIARQITQAHGGTITVDSTLDAGTTFTVRLPGQDPRS
ncbi:HAMP domain-containing sensor histidine kinase [Kineosporia sp. NBRC 101731]|uniref:sensor histidine kinase n=1 Tax=Kineosporia sp. NBRC 101731 TaxID=3032199 RepID=UPI0024A466D7|nr:HAMP domain-containing sensor histidine kinase [Kineosporia sp. NBRC 101731]GLY33953.1 two-component sensor histidine kinase [Kineosporia sp. NBRC 101731]